MRSRFHTAFKTALPAGIMLVPMMMSSSIAVASVESSLAMIQNKLMTTLLPLAAILGLIFAGISFVMGNPGARTHLILAMIGAAIGFGAPSIVAMIREVVM